MFVRMNQSVYNGDKLLEKGDIYDLEGGYASRLIASGTASAVSANDSMDCRIGLDGSGNVTGLVGPDGSLLRITKTYTWAALPSASLSAGVTAFVTDIGVGGSLWSSNGAEWSPLAPITLASQNYTSAGVGRKTDADTNETDLFTMVIPGGLMGLNRCLEVLPVWSFPSSATTKTVKVKFGASSPFSNSRTTSTYESPVVHIINRNSANSQFHPYNQLATFGTGLTASVATSSQNTASDLVLAASAQWGTAGTGSNIIYLESIRVRLIP